VTLHDLWQARLEAALAMLDPVPVHHGRLYRIQPANPVPLPAWKTDLMAEHALAQGRWFTHEPASLAFYAADMDHPVLHAIVLPQVLIRRFQLSALPDVLTDGTRPRAFSRDLATEYFLPRAYAEQALPIPWLAEPAPRRARHRPMSP